MTSSFLSMIGLGSAIAIAAIYFVNKYPGEPTEYVLSLAQSSKRRDVVYNIVQKNRYEAFAAEEASTMDVVRAFEKIQKGEKSTTKEKDSLMGDFETLKKSKQYDKMKRMLGLTDTKIELAYELAKQGKMLPEPRAVRAVKFLDNLFLLLLLIAFVYAVFTTYDVRAAIRNMFPTEFDLMYQGYQRLSDLFSESYRRHVDL